MHQVKLYLRTKVHLFMRTNAEYKQVDFYAKICVCTTRYCGLEFLISSRPSSNEKKKIVNNSKSGFKCNWSKSSEHYHLPIERGVHSVNLYLDNSISSCTVNVHFIHKKVYFVQKIHFVLKRHSLYISRAGL